MKNTIARQIPLLLCGLLISAFCSCQITVNADYGTLSIDNIVGLGAGQSARINARFSKPEYAALITYTFEGGDISIDNNTVLAINSGKTIVVNARSAHHLTSFSVTTIPAGGDTFSIKNVDAWIGYPPSEFFPTINDSHITKTVTYNYDETKLAIDGDENTVRALVAGTYTVSASADGLTTTFLVNCLGVDKSSAKFDTSWFEDSAVRLAQIWKDEGGSGTTTLFIGDSFFDSDKYWTTFYDTYSGMDALCLGISSTTSYDWEIWLDSWLGQLSPSNIVMHVGTNNVYDDNDSAAEATQSIQRMFTLMRGRLPDTKVYYFGISQRGYEEDKIERVSVINEDMQQWCADRDWITYLDTPHQLSLYMLRDYVHPKLEYYYIFTDEIDRSDIVIVTKNQ